ncbi:MAG: glutathione S-transferase family protein [Roseitalea sp.]|uniref:glutathione S-transferase family protein n=1 Tax=Oceaniradius stylonematis TaxID=2184161 RepID=UPI001B29D788|nr:glutathione S-transferase family protein [Roseitalea sp.]MBO6953610.1 glutathione S-transferase family protein [Rhizobiaceae bacterium]MBO6593961.1 glutathione S-transferase family protein [Roseitalea sp.]MBO6601354.1 glutathione S-transferase family protein [Roseitalea sp.]MBO6612850.1 glutathione S-transferase family protein [Roseitalea sp.]
MALTFYTNPMSRAQIARWALHEVGADYQERILGFGAEMKSADYLAVNPMGKVPAIVHDDTIVTEAAAICLYLAEAFPEAGLAPQTRTEKADCYRWMFFAAGPVEQAITSHAMKWDEGLDAKKSATLGFGTYDAVVHTLSAFLEGRDYVCGGRFTAADLYVGAQVDWGLQFGTMPSTPAFETYAARLRERSAYKAARKIDADVIAAMQAETSA